jgi:glycerol-3-phosphate dehydrogenase
MSLSALADTSFDLLVVGGGIHGAFAAWDAARRGLSVALIDRADFGAAASANSLKIVHGGFRYLQSGDVGRLRASSLARADLLRLAPHLVAPLPCTMPASRTLARGRLALGVALAAYETLALGARSEAVPRGRLLDRATYVRLAHPLALDDAPGGVLWYDGILRSPDRLLLAVVRSAMRDGAVAVNYVEALSLRRARGGDGAVEGARVRDETGEEFDVRARVTLLAANAGTRTLLPRGSAALPPFACACNLVLDPGDRPLPRTAVAIPVAGRRRMLFAVPWCGRLMLGTSQDEAGAPAVVERAVDELLAATNRALPALALSRQDVRLVHRGLLPGTADALLDRPVLIDHAARDGIAGLVTMLGVKWTTARGTASRAVSICARRLGAPGTAADRPLLGAEDAGAGLGGGGAADDAPSHLWSRYGTCSREVTTLAARDPELGAPLAPGAETIGAEVAYAIRAESARHLDDIVMRRTDMGSAGPPASDALEAAARIAARELGWSDERVREERRRVERYFRSW